MPFQPAPTWKWGLIFAVLITSCAVPGTSPTPTPVFQPTATSIPTPSVTPVLPTPSPQAELPAGEGPCTVTAQVEVPAYLRPDERSDRFGFLGAGEQVVAEVRTKDGWLGFDPGVAQAGNVGVFRYRWIMPDPAVRLEGNCAALPIVEKLPAGICFAAAFDETPVRAEPKADADIVVTLGFGHYVAVTGRSPDGNWVQVDLATGNVSQAGTGWAELTTLSLNGPCE